MKLNKTSLMARISNLSQEKGINFNIILSSFFFDAFIARLEKSEYRNDFILKGGFYLSNCLGIKERSTADIDFLLEFMPLEEEKIKKIVTNIAKTNIEDGISFIFKSISQIRDKDQYGGFNIAFESSLENIRVPLSIDIATGDPITPGPVEYHYLRIITNDEIKVKTYNLETLLAEKIQTIIARGIINSRMKDFYDVYAIKFLKWDEIDKQVLIEAFKNTFAYRNSALSKKDALNSVNKTFDNETMNIRWSDYCRKKEYAKGILFSEVKDVLIGIIKEFFI